jgi:hypothetical protein
MTRFWTGMSSTTQRKPMTPAPPSTVDGPGPGSEEVLATRLRMLAASTTMLGVTSLMPSLKRALYLATDTAGAAGSDSEIDLAAAGQESEK